MKNMHHLAIMKKSLGFLEKIISWEKIIESRWYLSKKAPYWKTKVWDIVFFQNSWEKVSLQASVKKVLEFEKLNENTIKSILIESWEKLWLKNIENFYEKVKDKKYCILIFLDNIKQINPFSISKKWFWNMCAWISIVDIEKIKK